MKLNILIGGKAGQGTNKISSILSNILTKYGYFTFNYRDYQSLIRGGHNFNVICISDLEIQSHESKIDILVAFDKRTIDSHKNELKKDGIIINSDEFLREGKNLNIALAGCLVKILGIPLEILKSEINSEFKDESALISAEKGYNSRSEKYSLKKLNNKINILSGGKAVALGARKASLDVYIAYPMSPSTNVLHELAKNQVEEKRLVFQAENEISVINMALGASFTGAKTLIGTSGGGFDLMSEGLSMQGGSEIPLTIYLASRPGPATGVPTYTAQSDLDTALRAGHGEFSRIVIAPATPVETIEKTTEALLLSEKFKSLSIILSDKLLAESEYSSTEEPKDIQKYKIERNLPGEEKIVKTSSYECDEFGNSTELATLTEENTNKRLEKYENAKNFINENFEMIKIHGKKESKNLIIGWGSTSNAIIDSIKDLDVKFLQVIYMKPLSNEIRKEIEKSDNTIIIECNSTGQLGRLIREKTGIKVENRILKYDGRPFYTDELKGYLEEWLSK